jgi:hypothetical protein
MKQVLIVTNLLTAGFLLWLFLGGKILFTPQSNSSTTSNCNTCTNICSDYFGKSVTKYDVATLKKLVEPYKPGIGNKTNTQPAPNIWFSLDTLKRFIWNIEHNVCGIKCGDKNFNAQLGVRIYFAKYPDANIMQGITDLLNVNPTFANQQTLFMIPTFDETDITQAPAVTKHIDFDPTNRGTFKSSSCSFQKLDVTSGAVLAFGIPLAPAPPPQGNTNNTQGQNHGTLCPPLTCDGAAF